MADRGGTALVGADLNPARLVAKGHWGALFDESARALCEDLSPRVRRDGDPDQGADVAVCRPGEHGSDAGQPGAAVSVGDGVRWWSARYGGLGWRAPRWPARRRRRSGCGC